MHLLFACALLRAQLLLAYAPPRVQLLPSCATPRVQLMPACAPPRVRMLPRVARLCTALCAVAAAYMRTTSYATAAAGLCQREGDLQLQLQL